MRIILNILFVIYIIIHRLFSDFYIKCPCFLFYHSRDVDHSISNYVNHLYFSSLYYIKRISTYNFTIIAFVSQLVLLYISWSYFRAECYVKLGTSDGRLGLWGFIRPYVIRRSGKKYLIIIVMSKLKKNFRQESQLKTHIVRLHTRYPKKELNYSAT